MKKIILFIFLLLSICNSNAQRVLLGVTRDAGGSSQGDIIQYNIDGEFGKSVHEFNFLTGKTPEGKVFLASNGKLYGTTNYGGIGGTAPGPGIANNGYGVLYEYDLILDKYRVVHYFNYTAPNNIAINPTSGLIEPIPGKLYGGTYWGSFFVYDIATETVTSLSHDYTFAGMGGIYADLVKASNGFVYGISVYTYPCPSLTPSQPNNGRIVRINTTTNTAQKVADFNCDTSQGGGALGILIEALPNKLYFASRGGYQFIPDLGIGYPSGSIVEFNTATNTITSKFLFDAFNSTGVTPYCLVQGDNGNLFGVCGTGGDTYNQGAIDLGNFGILQKTGTIFEYNPTTNSIVKLIEFPSNRYAPLSIIKLSTGEFAGNIGAIALFKYNLTTNTLQFPDFSTSVSTGALYTHNLIEICRKPAYQEIVVNSFTINNGDNFSYDVQNTNATTYQWQQNGINVTGQTTGVLNLNNVTTANSGVYTCVMTNECGITTTAPLTVTVSNLGVNEVIASLEGTVKLFPNPANTFVNIELPKNITVTISDLKINDILGKQVYKSKDGSTKIDVSTLAKGVYILALKTNYGNWNGKFVKE